MYAAIKCQRLWAVFEDGKQVSRYLRNKDRARKIARGIQRIRPHGRLQIRGQIFIRKHEEHTVASEVAEHV